MIKSRALLRLATLAGLVLYCTSLPIGSNDDRPEIIEIIAPAQSARETLDSLNFGEPNAEASDRSKRTIGMLRELFPNLSKIIEQKIQSIVSFLIRTVGRTLLPTILGAAGGGNSGSGGGGTSDEGNKVSIDLGGFDSDETSDEDEEDAASTEGNSDTELISTTNAKNEHKSEHMDMRHEVQTSNSTDESTTDSSGTTSNTVASPVVDFISNNISSSFTDNETKESISSSDSISGTTDSSSMSSTLPTMDTSTTTTVDSLATALENTDSENQLAGAESQQSEVRVQFADSDASAKDADAAGSDQEGAASDTDGLALDDIDSPDENRDKRFLGGDSSGGSSSGGGSGNFLFDIIRLVAGSGGTEQSDEASNATDGSDGSGKAADNTYGEGIPGPVTRLFIIANRGIANLIQDLILRLAQTSERIVNFKARLITSII